MKSDSDVEINNGRDTDSPAGERSGNGSGSAMDAMLRERRADENQPAEENDAAEDAPADDVQRPGSR